MEAAELMRTLLQEDWSEVKEELENGLFLEGEADEETVLAYLSHMIKVIENREN